MRNARRILIVLVLFSLAIPACEIGDQVGPAASSSPIAQEQQPKDHRPDGPAAKDPQPLLRKFRSK